MILYFKITITSIQFRRKKKSKFPKLSEEEQDQFENDIHTHAEREKE